MRIAQISDLHFTKLTFNPFRLLSKRFLGHFNWIFRRKSKISETPLHSLPAKLKELGVDLILLNGDMTTTSLPKEFARAKEFAATLPAPWIGVPGNHDHYTYRAHREKHYYRHLPHSREADFWSLDKQGIETHHLEGDLWLIALDTARATNFISSRGMFSEELEKKLKRLLNLMPPLAKIMLFTHYPFLQNESPRRGLSRASALEKIIEEDRRIKIYLHGHTHRQTIADLQPSNLPLILDPGCSSNEETGSFHLLDIQPSGLTVELYRWNGETWNKTKTEKVLWTR